MQPERIGLIGFGEAGAVFSKALALSGTQVEVYDILLEQDDEAAGMRERILAAGCRSVSLDQVVENNEIILSTVLTHVALEVATTCTSMLKPGQVYVDLNSTSPSVKVELGTIIKPSGADFVEGAILGAIGATGAKTRILLAGEKGPETAERLTGWGLNASFYSEKIGDASTFKMLRSIFSKGLETLILELLIAGKKAGIHKDLWEDITDFMAQEPFLKIASNWGQTHAMAYKRRYHEMVQVVETMRELGVDPIMTAGTEAFFKRSLSLDLTEAFPEKPGCIMEVVHYMESKLHTAESDNT